MARLTLLEIEALIAAAGNADPAMWEDYPNEKQGDALCAACETGMEKLRVMLAAREAKRRPPFKRVA